MSMVSVLVPMVQTVLILPLGFLSHMHFDSYDIFLVSNVRTLCQYCLLKEIRSYLSFVVYDLFQVYRIHTLCRYIVL